MKRNHLSATLALSIMAGAILQFQACLAGVGEFRSLANNRTAVRTSLGLRYARPLAADKIEVGIGMSVTNSAENPLSYRIISEEDPNYAYDKFVTPVKAEVKKELDCEAVNGAPFQKFERLIVALQIPFPMKDGARYHVIGQGVGGGMVTGTHTAQSFAFKTGQVPQAPDNSVDLAVLGLRQIMPVGNGVIKLEFGPNFNPKEASKPENYNTMINGKSVKIINLGRITKVDSYIPVGWPFAVIPMHEVFLQLSEKFNSGDRISVEISEKLCNSANSATVTFNDAKTFSDSIKVNQIGYLTDSPVKIAYLGRWMGSFPEIKAGAGEASGADDGKIGERNFWNNLQNVKSQGEELAEGGDKKSGGGSGKGAGEAAAPADQVPKMGPALAFENAPAFHIISEKGGAPVFSSNSKLIHRSGMLDEGVHSVDHSGENVYLLDFTAFKVPGRYFISVPGVGCSLPFDIGDDAYVKAFNIQSYGVFAQRCGIELKPPYSNWHRIACHNKGLILTSQNSTEKHDIGEALPEKTIYEKTSDIADPASDALEKDPALVARYLFNGDFKDSSGKGFDLTPISEKARFSDNDTKMFNAGKCYGPTSDGGNNGAKGEINIDISNGLTVSFWMKKENRQKYEGFFSLGEKSANRFVLGSSWGVPILMAGKGNAALPAAKISRPANGTWMHITATLDPAGKVPRKLSLYENGFAMSTEPVGEMDKSISGPLTVAALNGDESGNAFFSDFRIYSRTLDNKEIRALATPHPAERPVVIQAYGGHHDAGDYNPRSHYEIAQKLMDAYEMAPQKFFDGQLNIPEKNNGLPDILDEAFWALRLWIDLQDKDGGVRNGTESNGDPNFIQTVELDTKKDYAYAKDAKGAFIFAGMMAQASRLWRANGKTAEADSFLEKAVKAYGWGVKNPLKSADAGFYGFHIAPPKAYAAAQLLHTTKDPKYNKDFLEICIWAKKPDADLEVYRIYDMQDPAWAYASCPAELADPAIQGAIKKAIIRRADEFIKYCSTMSYAFIRHPWAPINWGTGAYENNLNPIIQAYKLTGDKKYLYWIIRTCDNTLGANPLCRSYIVGAGLRAVVAPLHSSRFGVSGEVVEGQQVEGPVQSGEGYKIKETAYPEIKENLASLYTFVDCNFAISMNEGVSATQAQSMAVFGLLLPDRPENNGKK